MCLKTLLDYMERTQVLRQGDKHKDAKLFISFGKSHNAVSKDSIAHLIKSLFYMSGVDTAKFKAGSVRPVVVSWAKAVAVPVTCIVQRAGWSWENTFTNIMICTLRHIHIYFRMRC